MMGLLGLDGAPRAEDPSSPSPLELEPGAPNVVSDDDSDLDGSFAAMLDDSPSASSAPEEAAVAPANKVPVGSETAAASGSASASASGSTKFRSGWTTTPKVQQPQTFVPETSTDEDEMEDGEEGIEHKAADKRRPDEEESLRQPQPAAGPATPSMAASSARTSDSKSRGDGGQVQVTSPATSSSNTIVMQGYMMKRKGDSSRNLVKQAVTLKWVTRYFVLHGNGRLVYYKDRPAGLLEDGSGVIKENGTVLAKNAALCAVDIDHVTSPDAAGDPTLRVANSFFLELPDNGGRTLLVTKGPDEYRRWLAEFRRLKDSAASSVSSVSLASTTSSPRQASSSESRGDGDQVQVSTPQVQVAAPSTMIVMHGYMKKRREGNDRKSKLEWDTLYFVLRGDGRLVHYEDRPAELKDRSVNAGAIENIAIRENGTVLARDVAPCSVERAGASDMGWDPDPGLVANSFFLELPDGGGRALLAANGPDEKKKWLDEFRRLKDAAGGGVASSASLGSTASSSSTSKSRGDGHQVQVSSPANPSATIVMHGYMKKREGGDNEKKWETRYFVLRGDGRLVHYEDRPAEIRDSLVNAGPIENAAIREYGTVLAKSMAKCAVERAGASDMGWDPEPSLVADSFFLELPDDGGRALLVANGPDEKKRWLGEFQRLKDAAAAAPTMSDPQ